MAKLALVESDGDEDAGAMQSRDLHDSQVGQKAVERFASVFGGEGMEIRMVRHQQTSVSRC